MPDPSTLAALRTLVAAWTPPDFRPGDLVATGVPPVDAALGGGLPAGRLTELVAPPGTGGQSVLAALLGQARAARQRVALVDAADAFAPESVEPDDLRHLVWARPADPAQTLAVADLFLRDGNFGAVVLDLRGVDEREWLRQPKSSWHRLHRAAERQPGAALVLSPCELVPAVRWRLLLRQPHELGRQRWPRTELLAALAPRVGRGRHEERGELAG